MYVKALTNKILKLKVNIKILSFPKYLEATFLSKTGTQKRIWTSKHGNWNKMWTSKIGTGTECGLQIWVPEQIVDSFPVPLFEVQVLFRYLEYCQAQPSPSFSFG